MLYAVTFSLAFLNLASLFFAALNAFIGGYTLEAIAWMMVAVTVNTFTFAALWLRGLILEKK